MVATGMDLAHAHDRFAAKLLATAAVLALTITFAVRSVRRAPPYMMVNELVMKGLGKHLGHRVRVHGWISAGTISP